MSDDLISVPDIAKANGKRRQYIFKVIRRLKIRPQKLKSPERHGQVVSYITRAECEAVLEEMRTFHDSADRPIDMVPSEAGYFYLIQLEPSHDPGRFKVGFTNNLDERLRAHKTAAPLLRLVKSWPCRSLWEKTAIDCVCDGVEQLHTEVFRADDLDEISEKCEEFFALMPKLSDD